MFSTQFESCDARRALPCFDEPNLKATFDFNIEIPEDQVALSNMSEKEVKPGTNGRKVVKFDRTPLMSTYLLAWAFGDFEYVEDFTRRKYKGNRLPVRVYTTRGLKEQGRFGLENAHQVVDYFSEVGNGFIRFGILSFSSIPLYLLGAGVPLDQDIHQLLTIRS